MSNVYLLLYSGGSMPSTPDEQKKTMDAWGAWMGKWGSAIVDGGNPFNTGGKTVSASGAVSDGTKVAASGYTLIKADSMDKAVEMAKGCPVLIGGATVSVFETFDVMAAMGAGR